MVYTYHFQKKSAVIMGLNEAILLEYIYKTQDHALIDVDNRNDYTIEYEGVYWIKLPINKLEEVFPFWSTATISRLLSKLEGTGVLKSVKKNADPFDRTKSYRIDAEIWEKLMSDYGA